MRKKAYWRAAIVVPVILGLAATAGASGGGQGIDQQLQELRKLIEMQQKQLDKQASKIAELTEQLEGNQEVIAQKADKKELATGGRGVTSSFENVNVSLYGHINKAILYGDNGDASDWYFVDNINSQTRLGLRASIDTTSGWVVGGRLEYGFVSNGSSDVNQNSTFDATSSNFKLRWAEVSFKNDSYGKFSLGKGSSASDGTAEVDLSGTTVATYSAFSDVGGAFLWYDSGTGETTELEVGDVYTNMDGLSRTDRIRYDTPTFAGFGLAASASSGEAFDGALTYSRDFSGTKFAAALGLADPGDIESSYDGIYSGSASVLLPMGLNVTFSAGSFDQKESGRDDPFSWYTKLGYKTKFYEGATTAFAIDYGETEDLAADGDTAKAWSIAAVHNVIDWGTEFYLMFRAYELDRPDTDFDDMTLFMTGARVKF